MILVLLGTQDKRFDRLTDKLDELVKNGKIKDKVLLQSGQVKYNYTSMESFGTAKSQKEFADLIKRANLIISHGGVGSIIDCLRQDKPVIAFARLKEFKEAANDHQKQIIEVFSKEGYIIKLDNIDDLEEKIKYSRVFKPKKYVSNNENFVNLIEDLIDRD